MHNMLSHVCVHILTCFHSLISSACGPAVAKLAREPMPCVGAIIVCLGAGGFILHVDMWGFLRQGWCGCNQMWAVWQAVAGQDSLRTVAFAGPQAGDWCEVEAKRPNASFHGRYVGLCAVRACVRACVRVRACACVCACVRAKPQVG